MAGYVLTENDARIIKELVAWRRDHIENTRNRPHVPEQEFTSPEVYVAKTPIGGIPALTAGVGTGTGTSGSDKPGTAECEVYRLVPFAVSATGTGTDTEVVEDLVDAYFTRPLYNLSSSAIAGSKWVLAIRDKWGTWFATPFSSGGSSGLLPSAPVDSVQLAGFVDGEYTFTSNGGFNYHHNSLGNKLRIGASLNLDSGLLITTNTTVSTLSVYGVSYILFDGGDTIIKGFDPSPDNLGGKSQDQGAVLALVTIQGNLTIKHDAFSPVDPGYGNGIITPTGGDWSVPGPVYTGDPIGSGFELVWMMYLTTTWVIVARNPGKNTRINSGNLQQGSSGAWFAPVTPGSY